METMANTLPRKGRARNSKPVGHDRTSGVAFSAAVLRTGTGNADHRPDSALSVMERVQVLAAMATGEAGSRGVAKLLRVSEDAADKLILGKLQVTDKVLLSAARATQTSAHWILTGEGSMSIEPSPDEEEMQFISEMSKLDAGRALRVLMMMDLNAVLMSLPEPERMDCLSSVHRIVKVAQGDERMASKLMPGELTALCKGMEKFMLVYGVDVQRLPNVKSMFLPIHESFGVFGPEQGPSLVALVSQP